MDKVIKSLNAQHRGGQLERNTRIVLLAKSGMGLVELAAKYGISRQRVGQIVARYQKLAKEH